MKNFTEHIWWLVNFVSDNGLVPDGTKPLSEPMLKCWIVSKTYKYVLLARTNRVYSYLSSLPPLVTLGRPLVVWTGVLNSIHSEELFWQQSWKTTAVNWPSGLWVPCWPDPISSSLGKWSITAESHYGDHRSLTKNKIDGLAQYCSNSSVLAIELPQFCAEPSNTYLSLPLPG